VHIKLEKAGFLPFEADFKVDPGKQFVIRQPLTVAPAKLHVETTPEGAQVALAGQVLGQTPLETSLAATKGELVISLNGYEPIKARVTLAAGELTEIKKELKESQKFGTIEVNEKGGAYVEVYFNGKLLGNSYGVSGFNHFSLPVGRQRIVVRKGDKKKVVPVTIQAGQMLQVTVDLS
jgi:hypothetical protein